MRCKRIDSLSVGADGIMTLFEDVRGRAPLPNRMHPTLHFCPGGRMGERKAATLNINTDVLQNTGSNPENLGESI